MKRKILLLCLSLLTAFCLLTAVACGDGADKKVKVDFNLMGGSGTAEQITVTVGEPYGTLPTVTKTGYTFAGWYLNAEGTGNVVTAAINVKENKDHTLYAKWTPVQGGVAVSFEPGNDETLQGISVTAGQAYGELPSGLVKYGYVFGGWFTAASGGTEVASTTIVSNGEAHTLYAKWNAVTSIEVTFSPNGGSGNTANIGVTFGEAYGELRTVTKYGYVFDGWFTGENEEITESSIVEKAEPHTLTAQWSAITNIKVSFDTDGADDEMPDIYVTFGDNYGALAEPEKTGYTFVGWYTEANGGGSKIIQTTNVSEALNHTLYAFWTQNPVEVDFDTDGGSSVLSGTFAVGQPYGDLPVPAKTGYSFGGWFTAASGGGTEVKSETIVTNSTAHTLYAKWTAIAYTVNYDGNKPSTAKAGNNITGSTVSSSHTYDASKALTSNGFSLTGYTFAGWTANQNGSGTAYTNGQSVSNLASAQGAAVTLYAKWTANPYTVTYNDNKPSGSSQSIGGTTMSNSSHTYDQAKALNNMTRTLTGWTFKGWNTNQANANAGTVEFANQQSVENLASSGSVTLYAVWQANTYAVTFEANPGSGTTTPANIPSITVTLTYDQAAPDLLSALPVTSRYGYIFNGFYTASSSGTQLYNVVSNEIKPTATKFALTGSNLTTFAGSLKLYAQWTAKTGTVKYDTTSYAGASSTSGGAQWTPPSTVVSGFAVTFDAVSGAGSGTTTSTTGYGTNTSSSSGTNAQIRFANRFPTLYRTGYTFMGWWVKDGSNWAYKLVDYNTRVTIEGDHTVAARWMDHGKTEWNFDNEDDLLYFQIQTGAASISLDNGSMKVSSSELKVNTVFALPVNAAGKLYEFTIEFKNPAAVNDFDIYLDWNLYAGTTAGGSIPSGQRTFICPVTKNNNMPDLLISIIYKNGAAGADMVFYISDFKIVELDTNKTEWDFDNDGDLLYFQTPSWWSGKIDYSLDGSNGRMKVSGGSPRGDSRQQALLEFALPPPPVGKQYEFTIEFANPSMVDEFEISQNEAWPFDTSTGHIFGLYGTPMSSVSWPHTFTCLVTANSTDNLRFNVIYNSGASSSDMVFYISSFKIVEKTEWNFDNDGDLKYFQTLWGNDADLIIDNGSMRGAPYGNKVVMEFLAPVSDVGKQYEITFNFANPAMVDEFEIWQNDAWVSDAAVNYIYGPWGGKPMSSIASWPHTFNCSVTPTSEFLRFTIIYNGGAAPSDKYFYILSLKITDAKTSLDFSGPADADYFSASGTIVEYQTGLYRLEIPVPVSASSSRIDLHMYVAAGDSVELVIGVSNASVLPYMFVGFGGGNNTEYNNGSEAAADFPNAGVQKVLTHVSNGTSFHFWFSAIPTGFTIYIYSVTIIK